jgi:hypothetical protein
MELSCFFSLRRIEIRRYQMKRAYGSQNKIKFIIITGLKTGAIK